MEVQYLVKNT